MDTANRSPLVVVIHNSLTVRKIIEVSLKRQGIEAIGYADPLEALAAMALPGVPLPDLVFIEVAFPRSALNGFTTVQILRSRAPSEQLPIVMLARHDRIIDRLFARLAGANEFLTTPLTTEVLLGTVRRYIKRKAP
jgi:twitching motility two-component system response regulator PilG